MGYYLDTCHFRTKPNLCTMHHSIQACARIRPSNSSDNVTSSDKVPAAFRCGTGQVFKICWNACGECLPISLCCRLLHNEHFRGLRPNPPPRGNHPTFWVFDHQTIIESFDPKNTNNGIQLVPLQAVKTAFEEEEANFRSAACPLAAAPSPSS
jgi:hypothetical protein